MIRSVDTKKNCLFMASLTSKYRKQAKQIEKEVTAAGCTVEDMNTGMKSHRSAIRLSETLDRIYRMFQD